MKPVSFDSIARRPSKLKSRGALWTVAAVWIGGIVVGGRYLLHYETTPGMAATPSAVWPAGVPIQRAQDRPTIVMIAQPACSCTRASIGELETVISQYPDRAKLFIIFETNTLGVDPRQSSLWQAATRVHGATVIFDETASVAGCFQAETSGQVFLYDPDGKLRYSGGITISRGHAGESAGSQALATLLAGQQPDVTSAPVFGCTLN